MHTTLEYNELNSLFDAETWLKENYGCEFYKTNTGWLSCTCPFEDHEDSSPSFGINLDKGFFKCFGCGKEGNFLTLVSLILDINFYQAVKIVSEYCGVNLDNVDSLNIKNDKFKKALIEIDEETAQRKKIVQQATVKIKKIMHTSFEQADELYKKLDEYIEDSNYSAIKEMLNGRTG
jgi:DNA primase